MKGNQVVIDRLNELLTNELTAINQYFLHARILDNWGYKYLGKKIYEESIGEMKHAQKIIDRVLLLEGLPNLQALHPLSIGENVKECLEADLGLETNARKLMVDSIKVFMDNADHVSRNMIEEILEETEEHIDWIESQLGQIKDMGIENYLGHMIKDNE